MSRMPAFFQKQNYQTDNVNFDANGAYFKSIRELSKDRSREWEIATGKRIDNGRKIIKSTMRDFCVFLKKIAKKDKSAELILKKLKKEALKWLVIGSERFKIIEDVFAETRAMLSKKNNSKAFGVLKKIERDFSSGRKIFETSRNELVEKNLRLAVPIARQYYNNRIGLSFSDAIEEANIGMIKAAERFQYKTGFHFSTYAPWWMRQTVTRAYMDKANTIRIPVHRHELYQKTQKNLKMQNRNESENDTISETKYDSSEIAFENRTIFKIPYSLDKPLLNNKLFLKDIIPDDVEKTPEALFGSSENKTLMKKIIEHALTPREQYVIRKRYGFDDEKIQTLEEIGNFLHMTKEGVRVIQVKAIKKLSSPEIKEKLKLLL